MGEIKEIQRGHSGLTGPSGQEGCGFRCPAKSGKSVFSSHSVPFGSRLSLSVPFEFLHNRHAKPLGEPAEVAIPCDGATTMGPAKSGQSVFRARLPEHGVNFGRLY